MMNRLIVLLLLALTASLGTFGQTKRTVAVTPTLGKDIDVQIRLMIRSALEEGVANSDEYEAVVRGKIYEKLTEEFKFQDSGAVSDEDITKYGESAGAQLVCFSSIQLIGRIYRINYKLVEVRSGKVLKMESETVRNGEDGLFDAADKIADELFGKKRHINVRETMTPELKRSNSAEPEMLYVGRGVFSMGCTGEQGRYCENDETPVHRVRLAGFYIGKYEVTQEQWMLVMRDNPAKNGRGGNYPIENVSWLEIQEYIRRLNEMTGKQYRLPTEAEWEYAARGGSKSKGYKYAGDNDANAVSWNEDNSYRMTHPVGKKYPNELGIYDMSGNVSEWCQDRYAFYPPTEQTNPQGAKEGSYRVLRGGNWNSSETSCRISYRNNSLPSKRYASVGFRLVLSSD
jgi:formylglycine-generating enzyme required for sulfatase activity